MPHGDGSKVEEENMAARLVGLDTLKIQPFPLPSVGNHPHDVRVTMKAVGICGSDVHYLKIIEQVSKEVKILWSVTVWLLNLGLVAGDAIFARKGDTIFCPEMKFFTTPPVHGSSAKPSGSPCGSLLQLPENVSLEERAMCEPLSVGVHACCRPEVGPETKSGSIGLITMLAARAFGVPKIVIVDVDDNSLTVAEQLGADGIVKAATSLEVSTLFNFLEYKDRPDGLG
ncbi:hypothetical protein Bca4012_017342 [Brassica carinata]